MVTAFISGLKKSPVAAASVVSLCFIACFIVLGLVWSPGDPVAIDVANRLKPPSGAAWFGTDHFGRDVFTRILVGGAVSFRISALVVALALALGFPLGLAAGYFGGWIDRAIASVCDALLAMPGILLALALISLVGAGENGVIIALGLAYTPYIARVARASAIKIASSSFVEASKLMGHGHLFILRRHIAPNVIGPLTVLATNYFAHALLSESALSFLGLGAPPPYPSWGGLLAEARPFLSQAPWLSIFPGLVIMTTLLSINLCGDYIRDLLDPRVRNEC